MELRKDYFLDRWVIIATERKKRPVQFKDSENSQEGTCFFCPGNENLTPPEIGRIQEGDSWKIRWFANKFPVVAKSGNPNIQTHNEFFTFSGSFGYHEVIAETPDHKKQLWDLPETHIQDLLKVYRDRIRDLQNKPDINYVTVFKNHGGDAGTSLIHSHTQVVAQSWVPQIIREKISHSMKECPYCKILNIEKDSYRKCFENNSFVAFTPYASRFGMEIWIMPKKHISNLDQMHVPEFGDLAQILKNILDKLKELNTPYNFYLQYPPTGQNLHFHIEVIPRMAKWAGYEYSTNTIINAIPPEIAAKFYRGEKWE